MSRDLKSALYLVLAVCIFGIASTIARGIYALYPGLKSITLVQMRMFLGGLVFLLFCLIRNPKSLAVSLKDLGYFALIGICGIFIVQFFLMYAVKQINAGLAAFVQASSTLMLCAYSAIFMREKLGWNKVFGLVLGFVGIGVIFFEPDILKGSQMLILGILAALGSAVGKSTYILLGKHGFAKYDPFVMIAFALLIGGIFSLALDPPIAFVTKYFADTRIVLFVIFISVIGTVVPFILYFSGLRHLNPSTAGILNIAEPLAATLAGYIILGEVLRLQQLLGGLLIIVGITGMYTIEMRRKKITLNIKEN